MLDPNEFRDIVRQYFAQVSPEQFLEDQKKYCPEIAQEISHSDISINSKESTKKPNSST